MINEVQFEEISPFTDLKNKLWKALSFLEQSPLNPSEYYVILYLLILKRDGVLDELSNSHPQELKDKLETSLRSYYGDADFAFRSINSLFSPIISHIPDLYFYDLFNILRSIEKKILDKHFLDLFDELLYKISKVQGRFGGEFIVPFELSRFVCSLVDLPEKANVYNPFAGLASFGVFLKDEENYLGQEINQTTWAIGFLRIIAYQKADLAKFIQGNSINEWNPYSLKYDLIIANPPFNVRNFSYHSDRYGLIRSYEHFLIQMGLDALNQQGKLIAVIPIGFLTQTGAIQNLRSYLIEDDLLEMVISFPGGLLSNTGIPFAVIVINKCKKHKNVVSFIDSNSFVDSTSGNEKILKYNDLLSVVQNENESEYKRIVSNSIIREFNYNLNTSRYFSLNLKLDNDTLLVKLGDLVNRVTGQKKFDVQQGVFVRIRDLKDDKLNFQLDLTGIKLVNLPKPARRISESCLLLAMRWKTLKPTYFFYNEEDIYIIPDTLALKIDETIVDINYLVLELHADYVTEQVESIRRGSVIPYIIMDDLFNIKIQLPSLSEQKAKVSGFKEAAVKMTLLEAERNAMAHGFGNIINENFASVKHSLGKPLLNISSSLQNIENALNKINKEWESIKINERMDVTLKDTFNSIQTNLLLIHSLLKNNERDFNVSNYPKSEIDFLKFIKSFLKRVKSSQKSNITVLFDVNPELEYNFGKSVILNGNSELLEIAFNNIVENANMHAFVDEKLKYKLEFRLSLSIESSLKDIVNDKTGLVQTFLKIEIANNGLPFPKNYTLEKLVRKNSFAGSTGNTGIGGFDINEIVKYHLGKFDLITDNSNSEFVTNYVIMLPID